MLRKLPSITYTPGTPGRPEGVTTCTTTPPAPPSHPPNQPSPGPGVKCLFYVNVPSCTRITEAQAYAIVRDPIGNPLPPGVYITSDTDFAGIAVYWLCKDILSCAAFG